MTVEKKDGHRVKVKLQKEIIQIEENVINSYILNGTTKMGYLSLPSFYGDEFYSDRPGCATDVAKEIVKLKRQNIAGLILDLRFNSGGRINEAVELAGLFIDAGPVCIVEGKDKQPVLLKDSNRGAIYDGPLVVLVNRSSASASEMFCAAMQDYNRALIVGEQTFGKSTGQSIFPLHVSPHSGKFGTHMQNNSDVVVLTNIKLYRIDGTTYQQTGIIPDVELPGFNSNTTELERDYENAIDNTGISKKVYYHANSKLPIDSLKARSKIRIENSDKFAGLKNLDVALAFDNNSSMSFGKAYKQIQEVRSLYADYEKLTSQKSQAFMVENNNYNDQIIEINEDQRRMLFEYATKINSDIYVEEAYFILNDLINFLSIKNRP